MENKNNKGVIILLSIIIVILAVLCILFATDTITLNTKTSENTTKETSNSQSNTTENNNSITKEEATNILKTAADRLGKISNGYPYCGENMTYDEVDVILNEYNLSTHTASKDYTSLENMKDDLRKYMSDELINKYIKDSYYIEKEQKLYCTTPHKGTDIYDKNNSNYTVETFTNEEIIAKGIIATYSEHADEYKKNVNIEMKKISNNWQITKYEVNE